MIIKGKIRIRKLNDNEIIFDEEVDATMKTYGSDYKVSWDKDIKCNNNETLSIGDFIPNDIEEFKQYLIERDANINLPEKINSIFTESNLSEMVELEFIQKFGENEKEYEWEILPYTEEGDFYYLSVRHHKNESWIELSNLSDPSEAIIINDPCQLDALIERLQKAKEFFNK